MIGVRALLALTLGPIFYGICADAADAAEIKVSGENNVVIGTMNGGTVHVVVDAEQFKALVASQNAAEQLATVQKSNERLVEENRELAKSQADTDKFLAEVNGGKPVRRDERSRVFDELLRQQKLNSAVPSAATPVTDADLQQRLTKADAITRAMDELLTRYNERGDALGSWDDLAGALEEYRTGTEISQALAAADPDHAHWQHDLAIGHQKMGDTRRTQGDLAGALRSYQAGMGIQQKLVATHPHHAQWLGELSMTYERIGDIQNYQGDPVGALESYRASMAIAQMLAAAEPGIAEWQHKLSMRYEMMGALQRTQGDLAGALASYQAKMDIAQKHAAADPTDVRWQCDLVVSMWKLGTLDGSALPKARRVQLLSAGLRLLESLQKQARLAPVQMDYWPALFRQALREAQKN